jgi:hypothetical protein
MTNSDILTQIDSLRAAVVRMTGAVEETTRNQRVIVRHARNVTYEMEVETAYGWMPVNGMTIMDGVVLMSDGGTRFHRAGATEKVRTRYQ